MDDPDEGVVVGDEIIFHDADLIGRLETLARDWNGTPADALRRCLQKQLDTFREVSSSSADGT